MAEEPESKSDAQVPVHLNRKQRRALMREQELLQAQAVPQRPGEQEVPQLHEGTGMGDKPHPTSSPWLRFGQWLFGAHFFDVAFGALFGAGLSMALASDPHDIRKAVWIFHIAAVLCVLRAIHWIVTDTNLPLPRFWMAVVLFGGIGASTETI